MTQIDFYKGLNHEQMDSLIACFRIAFYIGQVCETSNGDNEPFNVQIDPTADDCMFDSCEVWFADGTNVFIYPADNGKELKLEFQCYLDDDPREGEKVYTVNLSNWASETLDALRDWGAPMKITE